MPLLEREMQLRQLEQMLAEALDGNGRLAVLSGEAGAGKTSVVQQFLLSSGKVRILRSFCEDLLVPDPLGPLYDLAREARLPLPRDVESSQLSLYSRVLDMLAGEAEPTLVVIEDVHWADDATLDFIRFIGRRIGGTHLLVLLTARTEDAHGQKRLRRALVDIPPHNITRVDVPLLTLEAVSAIASAAGLNSQAVYETTAGNAFFVTELVAANTGHTPPETVTAAVLGRADKLGSDARVALDLVAMFPRRAEIDVLLSLFRSTDGLDEAIASGLLERTTDAVVFRHEIARRAVELSVPEAERRSLNAEILAVLQRTRDVPLARLVHHAREAGDPKIIHALASSAGDWAASVGAHHEAVDYYRTAFLLPPRDAALAHSLAVEYSLTGRLDDAITIETEALAWHRNAGDRVEEGDSLRWLSRFSYLAGRRDDTDRYGYLAIAVLQTQTPGPELAMAYSNHAQLDMLAERVASTLEWGGKAMALAEQLGRDDIICATLNNLGQVQRWIDPDEARRCLRLSLEMALACNWHEHAARAYANWACMDLERMDFAAAEMRLSAGIAYCAERDLDTLGLYMTGWLAQLRLRQGDWSSAAEVASQVLNSDLATPLARFQAADVVARLRIRRGDPGDHDPLNELEAVLGQGREFQRLSIYATLMAERAWIIGAGVDEAVALIEEALGLVGQSGATQDLMLWRSVLRNDALDWSEFALQRHSVGMPFEHAVALLHNGNGTENSALLILDQLGAGGAASRARGVLSKRGIRGPRRTSLANESGLTNRELDVLKLLSEGLSDKAIAATLNVSPKTVGHHVSAALQKLGVKSRGQAAALARERGLT